MKNHKHIGLFVDASRAYGRAICHGVADFAATRPEWVIVPHERPELGSLPASLIKSRLDGIIAYIPNQKLYEKIRELGVPAVDVHGRCKGISIPVIESDAVSIVRSAVEFFVRSAFRHFAYCGYSGVFFSDQRKAAFVGIARRSGFVPHVFSMCGEKAVGRDLFVSERSACENESELAAWLESLPKPVAILACNDICGQQIINACGEAGIRVPGDVAVLGVDNDEVICRLSHPPLSSIEVDARGIGRLAGKLIADMLDGAPVSLEYSEPPLRVVERESTDVVAVEDPLVLGVIREIRQKACGVNAVSVEQLCQAAGVSRVTLDRRFLQHLGRSVSDEILRHRLERSRQLLTSGDLPLEKIAVETGFSSATYFCRFFKRQTGETPANFRRGSRSAAGMAVR